MHYLRSRLFFPILIQTALIGSVCLILPAALVLLSLRCVRAYRCAVRFVCLAWFTLAASLLERESDAIVATGDVPAATDRTSLILCNHRSRIDWMYIWVLVARFGTSASLKIALKDSLRSVPFFGWAMQAFLFIFLSRRDREHDLTALREGLRYAVHTLREPTTFLLFPEGTDLSPSSLEKSKAWAAARGLAPYHHLLQPHAAGFVEAVGAMGDALDAVYDVTVLYTPRPAEGLAAGPGIGDDMRPAGGGGGSSADPWRPSEVEMLSGRFPKAVHLHVRRIDASELPKSPEKLTEWLNARWAAKEALLAANSESLGAPNPAAAAPTERYARFTLFWGVACALLLLGLFAVPVLWLPLSLGCVALALATRFGGGLGAIEMAMQPAQVLHRPASGLVVPLV